MAYTPPALSDFRARYPAFASVADATVTYWLTDALRYVDESWMEADYAPAIMAAAAHAMALAGFLSGPASLAVDGVTSFKSGSFSASIDASVAQSASSGGWGATRYGREFQQLQRRNFAGPRLIRGTC
ncbi:MAG: DUF4054 domain-containing protein [Sphingomonadales bacterium]|nr:MAG: DUF4054 domain-containing protein [Sphingomonadales bacterium]